MHDLLELNGHDVLSASNGREGLTHALSAVPDLIICDLGLPGMDGLDVLAALKTAPRTHGIPVCILTAQIDPEISKRAQYLGAITFITKPFTEADILAVIAGVKATTP